MFIDPDLFIHAIDQTHKEHIRQTNNLLIQDDTIINAAFDLDEIIKSAAVDTIFDLFFCIWLDGFPPISRSDIFKAY